MFPRMVCIGIAYFAEVKTRLRVPALCGAGLLALSLIATAQDVPATPPSGTAQQPAATQAPATTPATPDATQTATPPAAAPGVTQTATPTTDAGQQATQQLAAAPAAGSETAPPGTGQAAGTQKSAPSVDHSQERGITEEELKALLVGKPLYLRGGYLDNSLTFNEHGGLIGHSAQGSYTLSAIQIDKVHLTKHKVELEGARYGLHFLGALPYEDPTKALDRVKITPKKKVVKITIDRELVVTPKKKKEKGKEADQKGKSGARAKAPAASTVAAQPAAQTTATDATAAQPARPKPAADAAAAPQTNPPAQAATTDQTAAQATPPTAQTTPAADAGATQVSAPTATEAKEPSDADEAKAEMAAAPAEERPADPSSVTTTLSPAHATKLLKDALDKMFAPGLDDRMMAEMPDFWKLYYQAVADKTDYRPKDPGVLRQNTVDKKAELVSKFEPESNEWAQASGVAGMALYHTVIGADGKPTEIAVARPIGFGLDESAVSSIRKATFVPAIKDGKPVPVLLDLVVQFRIYSKRTSVAGKKDEDDKAGKQLPGPYSLQKQ